VRRRSEKWIKIEAPSSGFFDISSDRKRKQPSLLKETVPRF